MLQLIKLSPNLGIIWRMVKVSLWLKQEGAKPADFRAKIYLSRIKQTRKMKPTAKLTMSTISYISL